jgi:predicted flap endonuclease-1-like 5' DNA nuclease
MAPAGVGDLIPCDRDPPPSSAADPDAETGWRSAMVDPPSGEAPSKAVGVTVVVRKGDPQMAQEYGQTLAVFVLDAGKQSRRLLKRIQEIDDVDPNVKIVDAAIADRSRFRVKVHQTTDLGGAKGAARGAGLGVIVGAIVLGPAGAVVGGAAAGVLNGVRNRMHDIGIDDKFMRKVTKELDKGKSALFILYEGNWAGSIGMIEQAITTEKALLIESTLPPATAAALKALVDPAVEELGGAEVVADYEVETEDAAPAAAETAAPAAAATEVAAPAAKPDDLTQLSGIGPKASDALAAAGITTYAALAQANEPTLRHALHSADMVPPANVGSWPMQASYAASGDWQGLMKYNKRNAEPSHHGGGKKSGAAKVAADDLTQLHGIGPRISMILAAGGVTTYAELEHTEPSELRKIIAAGGALPPSSLDTWPTQASYAVRGDWSGLANYNAGK